MKDKIILKDIDWKETIAIIEKWYHEQNRAKSTKNSAKSSKK